MIKRRVERTNGENVLTDDLRQVIREQLEDGVPTWQVAGMLDVKLSTVRSMKAHVTRRANQQALERDLSIEVLVQRALRYARKRSDVEDRARMITFKECMNLLKEQNGRCNLTDLEFNNINRNPTARVLAFPWRPSLDRIDNSRGYVKSNVRLVAQCVNFARGEWPDDVFFEMCAAGALYAPTAKRKIMARRAAATRKKSHETR